MKDARLVGRDGFTQSELHSISSSDCELLREGAHWEVPWALGPVLGTCSTLNVGGKLLGGVILHLVLITPRGFFRYENGVHQTAT